MARTEWASTEYFRTDAGASIKLPPSLSRREFVIAGLAGAGSLLLPRRTEALPPVVLFVTAAAGSALIGLIVTDVVHGILAAYDIDIRKSTEDFVRRYVKHEGYQVAEWDPPRGVIATSREGRCDSGEIRVYTNGCEVSHPRLHVQRLLCPGPLLWAASSQAKQGRCLNTFDSGYPVRAFNTVERGGYGIAKQDFQHGVAELVLDPTYPGLEGLYKRNVGEEMWYPARG